MTILPHQNGISVFPSRLPFVTAREIADTVDEKVTWIAEPYLVQGGITEVSGKAKVAGKTTWLTHLCACVVDGVPFMGYPTTRTAVVYLTEQNRPSFREVLRRAGLLDHDDFAVLFWKDAGDAPWPEVVAMAVAECRRRGAGLLVVDTLAQWARLEGDSENNAGTALEALAPLQRAAAGSLAVAVARHDRKSGGGVGDSSRGSSAFVGAVDIVVSIRRPEGRRRPSVRVIHALSRFDETPDTLTVDLGKEGYSVLGTGQDAATVAARERLLSILPRTKSAAMESAAICKAAALSATGSQRVLAKLLDDETIERRGNGRRNDPYRYWIPSDLDSDEDELDTVAEPPLAHSDELATAVSAEDRLRSTILAALKERGSMSQSAITRNLLHGNTPAERVRSILESLESAGLVTSRTEGGIGRPAIIWSA